MNTNELEKKVVEDVTAKLKDFPQELVEAVEIAIKKTFDNLTQEEQPEPSDKWKKDFLK